MLICRDAAGSKAKELDAQCEEWLGELSQAEISEQEGESISLKEKSIDILKNDRLKVTSQMQAVKVKKKK